MTRAIALLLLLAACSGKRAYDVPTVHIAADGTSSYAGTDEELYEHKELTHVVDPAAPAEAINVIALGAYANLRRVRLRVGTREVHLHLLLEGTNRSTRVPLPAEAKLRANGVILRTPAGRQQLTIPQLDHLPKEDRPVFATWFLQRLTAAQVMAALAPLSRAFTHIEIEYDFPPRHRAHVLPFPDTTAPNDD